MGTSSRMDSLLSKTTGRETHGVTTNQTNYILIPHHAMPEIPYIQLKLYEILSGNQFLLKKFFLCLASFYAFRLYEISPGLSMDALHLILSVHFYQI